MTEAAQALNVIENEVKRRMAEGQFSTLVSSVRSRIELETMFPEASFRLSSSGVHFRVSIETQPALWSKVRCNK